MARYLLNTNDPAIKSAFITYVQTTYLATPIEVLKDRVLQYLAEEFPGGSFFRVSAQIDLVAASTAIGVTVLNAPDILPQGNPVVVIETLKAKDYKEALYQLLEDKAQARGNLSSMEILSWQTSTVKRFKKEAVAFATWRDQLFDTGMTNVKAAIIAGTAPDIQTFIAGLPTFESILATTVV